MKDSHTFTEDSAVFCFEVKQSLVP